MKQTWSKRIQNTRARRVLKICSMFASSCKRDITVITANERTGKLLLRVLTVFNRYESITEINEQYKLVKTQITTFIGKFI